MQSLLFNRNSQKKNLIRLSCQLYHSILNNCHVVKNNQHQILKEKHNYIQIISNYLTKSRVFIYSFDRIFFKNTPSSHDQQSNNTNKNASQEKPNSQPPPPPNPNTTALLILSVLLAISYMYISRVYLEQIKQLENRIAEEEKKNASSNQTNNDIKLGSPQQSSQAQLNISNKTGNLITWQEFTTQLLAKGLVNQILASRKSSMALVVLNKPIELNGVKTQYVFVNVPSQDIESKLMKAQDELNIKYENRVPIVFKDNEFLRNLLNIIGIGLIFFLGYKLVRGIFSRVQTMQSDLMSQFTKAKFTVVDPHLKSGVPKISFKDVAGLHEAKIEIKEFVDYLKDPERFTKLGARVPKGALLTGPPGCGKTLLAKAVASEANVPFFNMAGTEFIEMIGGVGAARVRSLFEEAKKQSPSIIYIDEIDAVGRKRSDTNSASTGGGSNELDQTLNQLLVSMDGLESNSNVIVLASTNRADILDKALLRPGRLDRHISIDLPTYLERIEILNVHTRNLKLGFDQKEKDVLISQLSHLTPRFSGADLANVCNESALLAARDGQQSITKKNFYSALERVLAGAEKRSTTISVEDRNLLAYQECGKVIVSWFHESCDLILKISLLSRTKSNAFTQFLPIDRKLYSKEELFDQMCLFFGGRVAETIVFNRKSTNSEQDLKRITKLAYAQVESFGMSPVIGNMSFPTQQEERAQSGGMVGKRPYSKKLRSLIDLEVNKLMAEAHSQTEKTIRSNMDKLHKIANELLKRETLSYEDICQLIGPPLNNARYNLAISPMTANASKADSNQKNENNKTSS